MKLIISIFLLLLINGKTYADYEPTPLPQLIIKSDLIIVGEIISLDSYTFTLKVSSCVKGDYTFKNIKIKRFENWTCAARIAEYQIGQQEIIFLVQNKKTKEWLTMGAGNEGELLIQNDSITYEDIYSDSKSSCSKLDYFGHKICGWKYSLGEFKNAILFYLSDFPKLKTEFQTEQNITNRFANNEAYKRMIDETISSKFILILTERE
jgi:hypothetical protein